MRVVVYKYRIQFIVYVRSGCALSSTLSPQNTCLNPENSFFEKENSSYTCIQLFRLYVYVHIAAKHKNVMEIGLIFYCSCRLRYLTFPKVFPSYNEDNAWVFAWLEPPCRGVGVQKANGETTQNSVSKT